MTSSLLFSISISHILIHVELHYSSGWTPVQSELSLSSEKENAELWRTPASHNLGRKKRYGR